LAVDFPAVREYWQDLASHHNNLGILLAGKNQVAKAVEQYGKALAIRQKLADDFPSLPEYRHDLARAHFNLGGLLRSHKQADKAAEQYGKALVIHLKLAGDFPTVPEYRHALAHSHNSLGALLKGQNQWDKAAEQYRKALAIRQKLADEFPAVPAYRQELAGSHNNLGTLLAGQNQSDKAAVEYRKALAIQQKLADEYPAVPEYQVELGAGCCNFGLLLRDSGKPADSLPYFDRAVAALSKVHQQDLRSARPRLFLRNSHWGRARAYDLLEKHAGAVKDWTRTIELSPPQEQANFRARRADARVRAGQVAEAVAEVVELMKIPGVPAPILYDFGRIYAVANGKATDKKQEYADQAMRMLSFAVQAGYKNAAHMAKDKDLDVLRDRDDFKKLMQSLAKPKEKQPARVPAKK
jgi:eukaryotic-like serine/threonine-protein kinase